LSSSVNTRDLRISFAEAIQEPKLLKARFEELALPQQTALKALYGVPLSPDICDQRGWSELDYFNASQGDADFDHLGYLTSVARKSYTPKSFAEGWFICGRRAGKSDALASTIVAYEAALGGHEQHVRKGQPAYCFQIAQDLRMARYSLNFIRATLESSDLLKKQIVQVTADRIDLKNGITIAVIPPTLKAVRGYACPVAVLDEVGVWYQDSDAANPDYEIWRAVKPAQLQFPNRLLVGISSPWNKSGLLFQYFEAGTDGHKAPISERDRFKDCLVWHSTSAAMRSDTDSRGKDRIPSSWFISEQGKDPRAFERECLAVFQDSISGFLSSELLRRCIDQDVVERKPEPDNFYVAAIDPAFRRDAFALVVAHATSSGDVVIDLIRRWLPEKGQPINPQDIFAELIPILRSYRIQMITSDQYHADTLQQLALTHGFAIESIPFTGVSKGSIYANLQMLVNQGRIHLLDHPEAYKELRSLERTLTKTGVIQISAPPGQHDDVASAIALATHKTAWMLPASKKAAPREPTYHERIQAQIARKNSVRGGLMDSWD
jgi:hypothetical protein